jgi:hypothetical protein
MACEILRWVLPAFAYRSCDASRHRRTQGATRRAIPAPRSRCTVAVDGRRRSCAVDLIAARDLRDARESSVDRCAPTIAPMRSAVAIRTWSAGAGARITPAARRSGCAERFAGSPGLRTRLQNQLREYGMQPSHFRDLRVARRLHPSTRASCWSHPRETNVQNVQTEKNQTDSATRGPSEPLIQRNRSVRILAKTI